MKKETWVLVANSSSATIYKVEDNHTLKALQTFAHPESRLQERDIVIGGRPGRAFDSMGPGRHAMEPKTTPKTNEFNLFAKELSHFIETAVGQDKLRRLYLAANPTFLGILRSTLPHGVKELIAAEIDKDITLLKPQEIRAHLPPVL